MSLLRLLAMVIVATLSPGLGACLEAPVVDDAACDLEHPCPQSYVCASGRCAQLQGQVVVGCSGDADCSLGVCLVELGFCVQCTTDAHCDRGVCLQGSLQCGCEQGSDCATGRCATTGERSVGFCASCYSDAQCAAGVCDLDEGICTNPQQSSAERAMGS